MKWCIAFVALATLVSLPGCTIVNGTSIVTGGKREPTSPDEVRIYREAPSEYEELAIVASSAGHDFKSREALLKFAFTRLKKEAAKVGANAILLMEIDERDAPTVTTTFGTAYASATGGSATATGQGVAVSRGDTYTRIRGLAVYVP